MTLFEQLRQAQRASCRRNCCRRWPASTIRRAWPTPSPRTWRVRLADKQRVLETARRRRAPGTAGRPGRRRDRRAADRKAHPRPRQVADGEEPARVLPQRADEGDPEGARRHRRSAERARRARASKIADAGMPKPVEAKARAELNKLKQMSPMSAEATVVRNYLDWLLGVPWKKRPRCARTCKAAQDVLDADHYGLEKVKERILEYLAVQQRVKQDEGPDPVPGRPARRRQDLARPVDRQGDQPQVRAHVARRRARRGRDPRPSPHLHRFDAGPDHPEPDQGRHARIRCSCSTRSTRCRWTSAAIRRRRCSKCSIRSRTTRSTTTTSKSTSTCREVMFDRDRELAEHSAGRCSTAWKSSASPATPRTEKINIAQRYLVPKQLKANGLQGERAQDRRARDAATSCATTRANPACATSSARSRRSAARWSRRSAWPAAKAAKKGTASASAARSASASKNLDKYLGVRKLRLRPRRAAERGRPGHRPGVDRSRRRPAAASKRTVVPGKGKLIHTGQLGDVMQESHPGGVDGRARARRALRHRSGFPPEARRAHARARRRDAEGRSERGHRDVHRAGLGADQGAGAFRSRDDRRDHAARPRAADRRAEGEAARGASRRHHAR